MDGRLSRAESAVPHSTPFSSVVLSSHLSYVNSHLGALRRSGGAPRAQQGT